MSIGQLSREKIYLIRALKHLAAMLAVITSLPTAKGTEVDSLNCN